MEDRVMFMFMSMGKSRRGHGPRNRSKPLRLPALFRYLGPKSMSETCYPFIPLLYTYDLPLKR